MIIYGFSNLGYQIWILAALGHPMIFSWPNRPARYLWVAKCRQNIFSWPSWRDMLLVFKELNKNLWSSMHYFISSCEFEIYFFLHINFSVMLFRTMIEQINLIFFKNYIKYACCNREFKNRSFTNNKKYIYIYGFYILLNKFVNILLK